MRLAATLATAMAVSGCAVHYAGNRYGTGSRLPDTICIVENPDVRAEFLQSLRPLLEARKIAVQLLPPSSNKNSCPFMLTYSATWHWDLQPYMRQARMDIYRDGQSFADSNYLAPHGLINMSPEALDETETKLEKMLRRMGLVAPTP
jgi:hypothetical protein